MRCLFFPGLLLLVACQQTPFSSKPQPEPPVLPEPVACECPPVVETVKPQPCPVVPAPKPKVVTRQCAPVEDDDLLVIGRVENVIILPDALKLKARIDTGAGVSSLHALDMVEFDRDGKPWVRFTIPVPKRESVSVEREVKRYLNIKELGRKPQRRPVVIMTIMLGSIEEQIEMTLTDRSGYLYQVLIGRNFLRDHALVDVRRKFTVKPPAK